MGVGVHFFSCRPTQSHANENFENITLPLVLSEDEAGVSRIQGAPVVVGQISGSGYPQAAGRTKPLHYTEVLNVATNLNLREEDSALGKV